MQKSQENMQYELYNELMKNEEMINGLCEPPEITQQRETAKKTLEVLNKARRIIRREVASDGGNDVNQSNIRDSEIWLYTNLIHKLL